MTIKTLYPNVRPTLDLAFAATKALDPRITFTRASTGTYVGSNGTLRTAGINEARFDHSPLTLESLGLLVEEARTNLLTFSEQFDNAAWSKFQATVSANTILAPDNTTTGDKLITNSGVAGNLFRANVLAAANYTQSIYAKAGEWSWLFLGAATAGNFGAWFNLSNGTVGTQNSGYVGAITPAGNGWYRCSITFTATAASWNSIVFSTNNNGVLSNGDGTSGIYLWGAQLEAGAFPTSYIPTTSATATRAADVASITGTNFSSWYRQDEGTFFCSTFAPKGNVIYGTGDTFDNTQYVTTGSSTNVHIRSGGVTVAQLTALVFTTALTNIAHGYAANSFAAVSNGGAITTDTSGAVPLAQVRLKLGSSAWDTDGSNNINGTMRRLTYWPWRLSNATLQALTS